MAPGTISQLSQTDAIAFRAKFPEGLPHRSQLYWRGPVLTRFDGLTWRPALAPTVSELPYVPDGPVIRYEITLEPHNKPPKSPKPPRRWRARTSPLSGPGRPSTSVSAISSSRSAASGVGRSWPIRRISPTWSGRRWIRRCGTSSRGNALVSGPDGLTATRALLQNAGRVLEPGGVLALEIDERSAEAVQALAVSAGWRRLAIHRDLFGRPRYALACSAEDA